MAWGWEGGFWWGKCPLKGVQQASYSVIPHSGLWDEARISEETSRWNEPLLAQLMEGRPGNGSESRSLVSISGGGVEIPAAIVEEKAVLIRLFNAEGNAAERTVSFHVAPARVELVELDGQVVRQLTVRPLTAGR